MPVQPPLTNEQMQGLSQAQIDQYEDSRRRSIEEEQRRLDPNNVEGVANEYGGTGGFAKAAQGQLDRAMGARDRQGYQYDDRQYGESLAQAQQARGQQQQGLGLLRDQMDLSQSSAASRAVLAGGQQAQGAQSSLATVARGGAMGRIAAQTQAARGNIAIGQQAAGQANVVRQQEAQRAGLAYGQQATAMREGDAATRGLEAGAAEGKAGSAFQNDAANAARERGAQNVRDAILKAQQASQTGSTQAQNQWQAAKYNVAQGKENAAQQATAAGMQMAGTAATNLGDVAMKYNAPSDGPDPERKKRDDEVAYSDERLKTGAVHMSEASEMARSTPGFAYKYKRGVPGENPEDQQYGVMAQDLEKTPMGKATVMNTPAGKKVDTKKLTMVHQAMFHDMQKQIDQLKGARK